MPYVAPNTITDIPKKYRRKLEEALAERAVMGYAFSWKALVAQGFDPEALKRCILAYNDNDEKAAKEEINELIATELATASIKTLRHDDPFGRPKDYIIMEGCSVSFSKQTAMDILVRECKVPAAKVAAIWEQATTKKKFTTIQARDVKGSPEEE